MEAESDTDPIVRLIYPFATGPVANTTSAIVGAISETGGKTKDRLNTDSTVTTENTKTQETTNNNAKPSKNGSTVNKAHSKKSRSRPARALSDKNHNDEEKDVRAVSRCASLDAADRYS